MRLLREYVSRRGQSCAAVIRKIHGFWDCMYTATPVRDAIIIRPPDVLPVMFFIHFTTVSPSSLSRSS